GAQDGGRAGTVCGHGLIQVQKIRRDKRAPVSARPPTPPPHAADAADGNRGRRRRRQQEQGLQPLTEPSVSPPREERCRTRMRIASGITDSRAPPVVSW